MSLILSAHKRDTMFQVSDRLVSFVRPGRDLAPLDIHGNKGVIYRALDGIVAIGFSGRAFIDGRRTDLWVAQRLTEIDDLDEEGSLVFFTGSDRTDLFHACERIREGVEKAFKMIRHDQHLVHSFVFAGWQKKRRNQALPILWRLDNSAAHPDRFRFTNLLRDTPDWLHMISFTPVGTHDPDEMAALLSRLEGEHSRESFLEELVEAIRRTAVRLPGVGRNCLSIQIKPDAEIPVVVRFIPEHPTTFMTRTVQGKPAELPFVFTPWVIGEGTLMLPNLLIGQTGVMTIGGLVCRFLAPPTPDAAAYGLSMHDLPTLRRMFRRPGR
jgi:hypothetical protein